MPIAWAPSARLADQRSISVSTISSYLLVSTNLAKWRAITAKKPEVANQTKYFQENISKVKSADELLGNARLFGYAMNAFGLGDRITAKGLMRQVLQQGVTDSDALANKLNNPNIRAFATAFDFKDNGASTTASPALLKNVVDRYTETTLEADQAKQNPGVELALYFERNAPNLTSVYGILADKKLLTVVQTALGISPLTSAQPVDTQKRLLSNKVNLADFKDPKKLQAFIARFAARYDSANGGAGGATSIGLNPPNALLLGA